MGEREDKGMVGEEEDRRIGVKGRIGRWGEEEDREKEVNRRIRGWG